jgi:sugar phosphate permease
MDMATQRPVVGHWCLQWRWLVVATSLLLWWIIGQFDKINISLVIADPRFLDELRLHGRYGELGGLMSTFFLGYGLSILLWGFLVDRFGPRTCLIIGTLGWGVALFSMSRATTLDELLEARFLLGVAEGNMWPVSNALTNRWFPTREHSRAQAFWLTGATLGTAIGVPVVTLLMRSSGWRGMIVALALVSLIPVANFAFIANRPQAQKGLKPGELAEIEAGPRGFVRIERSGFGELLRTPSFWLMTFCMIVSVPTIFTIIQWAPSFLTARRGLTRESMSLWLTVGYLLAAAGTVLVGYLGDRTMRRALTAAVSCMAFAILILPAALLLPPAASAVALAALTAIPCGIAALNGALLHSMVRPEAVARGTGVYSGLGTIISSAGPWAFGKLIGFLDGEYWGGFLFLAVLNVTGAICYLLLHRISLRPSRVTPAAIAIDAAAVSGSN